MIQPMSYGYPYGVKLDPKTLEEMQEKRNRMYVKMFYIQSNVYILQSCWINFMLIIMNTTISFMYLIIQLLRICCNYREEESYWPPSATHTLIKKHFYISISPYLIPCPWSHIYCMCIVCILHECTQTSGNILYSRNE